ncbi:hypothetical protein JZ751_006611, partial [Albula glossodonta]
GKSFAYWVGRHDDSHVYWGGSFPGIQKCGCAINQTYSDRGLLNFRDHLPVRRIVVSDTNRTASEAQFALGPLRCHGDRPTDLVFIFMVGDSLMNVSLQSPRPLNDDQWHWVQVEINVKGARLRVDQQPWAIRHFPGQTYITLKFTQPLLVGAARNKLKAYLGCLRGLRMNGMTLDLEGKVNESEGIRLKCTGQCPKAALPCRNGGRCIEGYASYTCDCNNTAYDGYYCHKDIGAHFEAGSWLQYSIGRESISEEAMWANWQDSHNFSLGYNQTSEEIEFSFSTSNTPAVLLYISFFIRDYIAIILKKDGGLDLRYRLGLSTHKLQVSPRNVADGSPHFVSITRRNYTVRIQVDYMEPTWETISREQDVRPSPPKDLFIGRVTEIGEIDDEIQRHNSPGLEGCISGVRYNIYTPLKEYFRPNETASRITMQGYVTESNCGAFPSVLAPVPPQADPWYTGPEFKYIHDDLPSPPAMTLAILLFLVLMFGVLYILYLFLYRYKGSYYTHEPKHVDSPSSAQPFTKLLHKNTLPQLQGEVRSG